MTPPVRPCMCMCLSLCAALYDRAYKEYKVTSQPDSGPCIQAQSWCRQAFVLHWKRLASVQRGRLCGSSLLHVLLQGHADEAAAGYSWRQPGCASRHRCKSGWDLSAAAHARPNQQPCHGGAWPHTERLQPSHCPSCASFTSCQHLCRSSLHHHASCTYAQISMLSL